MLVGTGAIALAANAAQPYQSFNDVVAQGIEVSGAPGDQLDQFVRAEMARWAKVIKGPIIRASFVV
ncbi:MAG TPA: hypothetical protein VMM27_04385 [Casimicrobiaceae bacterium]|nr:hypothetical protein [Casimicrobiaceae bacterium]